MGGRHDAGPAGAGAGHSRGGVHRVLPARNRAGRVHEQPDHRPLHRGGHVDLRPVVRFRRDGRRHRVDARRARAGYRSWPHPRGPVRIQRGSRRAGAGTVPDSRLGRARRRVDHRAQRRLLGADGCARSRVRRSVGGAPVHLGVQLDHLAVPDHRTARGARAPRCRCRTRRSGVRRGGRANRPATRRRRRRGAPTRWRS